MNGIGRLHVVTLTATRCPSSRPSPSSAGPSSSLRPEGSSSRRCSSARCRCTNSRVRRPAPSSSTPSPSPCSRPCCRGLEGLGLDAVLVVAMLGVFNRFLLRGGHRDDFLVIGASWISLRRRRSHPGVTFFFLLLAYVPTLLWALWSAMMLGTAEDDAVEPAKKLPAIRAVAVRVVPGQARFIALAGLALMAAGYAAVSVLPRLLVLRPRSSARAGSCRCRARRTRWSSPPAAPGTARRLDGRPARRTRPGTSRASLTGLYARLYVLDQLDGHLRSTSSDSALFPLGRRRRESRARVAFGDRAPPRRSGRRAVV